MANGLRVVGPKVKPNEIAGALEDMLTLYNQEANAEIAAAVDKSADELVRLTKATAPVGTRGSFKKNIAVDKRELKLAKGRGFVGRVYRATWYVKAPDYRLTHLLVHGHATKDGGRTKPDPFLQNAVDQVQPEFEKDIREVFLKRI